jgi:hypothetical protein
MERIIPIKKNICVLLLMWPFSSVAAQTYNIYFGDLHQHSIYSWDALTGALSPAAAYAYANHVAKIDFMAITDHTNGLSESNFQLVRSAAGKYDHPDSQFVAIAGQELGSLGNSGYGHINIFEPLTRADNAGDSDRRYNRLRAYQFLIDNNLLGQFNHPTTNGGNDNFMSLEYYQPVDLQINTLEVVNGKRSADYEQFYLLALANGWHIGAVGDQDNHAARYGDNISNSGDIYLTGVLAENLTKPKILDAIRNHRTYAFKTSPASDRMFLTEFTADGHWMGEIFDNDDNVVAFRLAAHAQTNFISAQLYKNGHLIKSFEPNANRFEWQAADSASFGAVYYFCKLIQEDTDVLWSSPVWVNSSGQYQDPGTVYTSISELRENFASGLPRRLGQTSITIRGIATAGPQFGFNGPGNLQDETGGIAVFGSLFVGEVDPNIAHEFEVTGVVSFFNGLTEFVPHAVKRNGIKSFPQPKPVTTAEIAENGENYEGLLVVIFGARITGTYPPPGSNRTISIDDGSGACELRIDKDTDIPGSATPQGAMNIIGIVRQFDTTVPYNAGYQILPRSKKDITLATTVADEEHTELPSEFKLHQNYPNPFNAGTKISFSIPEVSTVKLEIFSLNGKKIITLLNEKMARGEYETIWFGQDEAGQQVASGLYFAKLQAKGFLAKRKMVLIQ